MSRRPAPGRTAAREADAPYDEDGRPSKSQRKRESQGLQDLGEELAALSTERLAALDMPETLREALHTLNRTRSHEGRRRQLQYVGKLMRGVDEAPLREAVAASQLGQARDTLLLHEAERWRTELMLDDEALTRWVTERPDTDVQRLRTLVRNARAEALPPAVPGAAPRQLRSYRELFQFIRQQMLH